MPKCVGQVRSRSDPGLFASENRTLSVQCPLGMVIPVADLTDYQDTPPLGTLKDPSGGTAYLLARFCHSVGYGKV